MNKKTIIISSIIGLITFILGWFLHDMKQFADRIGVDSLQKSNKKLETITQEQLDSLMILSNINNDKTDYSREISGRFIMKGANSAGFDFINSSTVLWTNEIAPFQPDTLKICWLDKATFITRSTERINMDCPPIVSIYQVISFDEHYLIVKDIWTGWNEHQDEQIEFIKQKNEYKN